MDQPIKRQMVSLILALSACVAVQPTGIAATTNLVSQMLPRASPELIDHMFASLFEKVSTPSM
eukprot:7620812-Alexandrium_andersonii.AAC.1